MFFEAVYFGHFLSFYTMQLEPPKTHRNQMAADGKLYPISPLCGPPPLNTTSSFFSICNACFSNLTRECHARNAHAVQSF